MNHFLLKLLRDQTIGDMTATQFQTVVLVAHWLMIESLKPIAHGLPADETFQQGYKRCAIDLFQLVELWESSPDARTDYSQLMMRGDNKL